MEARRQSGFGASASAPALARLPLGAGAVAMARAPGLLAAGRRLGSRPPPLFLPEITLAALASSRGSPQRFASSPLAALAACARGGWYRHRSAARNRRYRLRHRRRPRPARHRCRRRGPAKVALLVPLSGANAELGQAMLDAAQLALFETGSDRLTLVPRDTGGTAAGAASAARAAIGEGAQLILGPAARRRGRGRQADRARRAHQRHCVFDRNPAWPAAMSF